MLEPVALSTYHLMEQLRTEYPEKEFTFVIGADLLGSLKSWDAPGVPNAGELLYKNCQFLLMERPGYDIEAAKLPSNFTSLTSDGPLKVATEETSSSEIRRRINFGDVERTELEHGNFSMVDGLLTPAVLAHVIRYRLYSGGA